MASGKDGRVKLLDLPGITPAALDSIDDYLTDVIAQCQEAITRWRSVKADDEYRTAAENRKYWQHARGALKWLRGNIRQARAARGGNGGRRDKPDSITGESGGD